MKNKERSLWLNLFLINSFIYVALAVVGPYMNVYYSDQGITPSKIGILASVASFSGLAIQPLWAALSDRTGRKKDIYSIIVAGCVIMPLTYYLGNTFGFFLMIALLYSIFNSSVIPLGDSLVTHQANLHNMEFSRIRLGGTLFYAATVFLVGGYFKEHSSHMFFFACGAYLILFILVRLLPKNVNEPPKAKNAPAAADGQGGEAPAEAEKTVRKGLLRIYKNKTILFVIGFSLINQIGLIFYQAYFGVYIQSLGYTQAEIGVMNAVSAMSEVPVLLLIAWFTKKFGTIKLMAFACVMMSLRVFLATGENLWIMGVSQAMHGLTYMICHYSSAVYISKNVIPGNEAKGMSLYSIVQIPVGAVLGNICGGFLCENLGFHDAYVTASCILAGLTVLIIAAYAAMHKRKDFRGD